MNTIQGEWEKFESIVIHPEAGQLQRKEMRKAFYAGFYSAVTLLDGLNDQNLSKAAEAEVLKGLSDEMEMFRNEICDCEGCRGQAHPE